MINIIFLCDQPIKNLNNNNYILQYFINSINKDKYFKLYICINSKYSHLYEKYLNLHNIEYLVFKENYDKIIKSYFHYNSKLVIIDFNLIYYRFDYKNFIQIFNNVFNYMINNNIYLCGINETNYQFNYLSDFIFGYLPFETKFYFEINVLNNFNSDYNQNLKIYDKHYKYNFKIAIYKNIIVCNKNNFDLNNFEVKLYNKDIEIKINKDVNKNYLFIKDNNIIGILLKNFIFDEYINIDFYNKILCNSKDIILGYRLKNKLFLKSKCYKKDIYSNFYKLIQQVNNIYINTENIIIKNEFYNKEIKYLDTIFKNIFLKKNDIDNNFYYRVNKYYAFITTSDNINYTKFTLDNIEIELESNKDILIFNGKYNHSFKNYNNNINLIFNN